MKWLLVSDTHRNVHELHAAVLLVPDAECVIHAGDETADATWLRTQVSIPVIGVAGNWDRPTDDFPLERIHDDPVRAFIVHGHRHGVKQGLQDLVDKAKANHAMLAFFGHTHIAVAHAIDGVIAVNPGSLSEPRAGQPATFAVITDVSETGICVTHRTTRGTTVAEATFSLD